MPKQDLGAISTFLFRFKGPFGARRETIPAGAIPVILPTSTVFLCLQRYVYDRRRDGRADSATVRRTARRPAPE